MIYREELSKAIEQIDISELHFGSEEAEKDLLITAGFFVPNTALKSILNWNNNIINGPKGSGKSAIYNYLIGNGKITAFEDDSNKIKNKFINSRYIPVSLKRKAEFKKLFIDNTNEVNVNGFEKVWCFILFTTIFAHIYQNGEYTTSQHYSHFLKKCKANGIWITLWQKRTRNIGAIIRNILKVFKVKIGPEGIPSFEFSGDFDFEMYNENLNKLKLHDLGECLELLLNDVDIKLSIAIDNLDLIFSYDKDWEIELVRALFEINKDLRFYNYFRFLIFIRTDILDTSRVDQIDKVTQSSIKLEWDYVRVENLIYSRVCSLDEIKNLNEKFSNINSEDKRKDLFKSLFSKTVNNGNIDHSDWIKANLSDAKDCYLPRTVIQLLNHYASSNSNRSDDSFILELDLLNSSLNLVSKTLFEILKNDYGIAEQVLEIIEINKLTEFKLVDIMKYFPENEVNFIINQLNSLVNIGVLSVSLMPSESRKILYSYKVSNLYKHHLLE